MKNVSEIIWLRNILVQTQQLQENTDKSVVRTMISTALPAPGQPYLDWQLSANTLTPLFDGLLAQNVDDVAHRRQSEISEMAVRLAQCEEAYEYARQEAAAPQNSCCGTYFGRNLHLRNVIQAENLLPEGPVKVFHGGSGLSVWSHVESRMPGWRDSLKRRLGKDLSEHGFCFEPFELALYCGPESTVHTVDFDARIQQTIEDNKKNGLFFTYLQPASMRVSRYGVVDYGHREGQPEDVKKWQRSVQEFLQAPGVCYRHPFSFDNPKYVDALAEYIQVSPAITKTIKAEQADLQTYKFGEESYDMVWLSSVCNYLLEPMAWSLLVRAIAQLPLPGERGTKGGLLVMDVFDELKSSLFWGRDSHKSFFRFLDLCGMKRYPEIAHPLECNQSMVLATRERESDWLNKKAEAITAILGP